MLLDLETIFLLFFISVFFKNHKMRKHIIESFSFFSVVPSPDFETGAVSIMDACGLGQYFEKRPINQFKNL